VAPEVVFVSRGAPATDSVEVLLDGGCEETVRDHNVDDPGIPKPGDKGVGVASSGQVAAVTNTAAWLNEEESGEEDGAEAMKLGPEGGGVTLAVPPGVASGRKNGAGVLAAATNRLGSVESGCGAGTRGTKPIVPTPERGSFLLISLAVLLPMLNEAVKVWSN